MQFGLQQARKDECRKDTSGDGEGPAVLLIVLGFEWLHIVAYLHQQTTSELAPNSTFSNKVFSLSALSAQGLSE
ncbi:hypothetical protein RJZ90_004320 [Blastomyces dermatitidis]